MHKGNNLEQAKKCIFMRFIYYYYEIYFDKYYSVQLTEAAIHYIFPQYEYYNIKLFSACYLLC